MDFNKEKGILTRIVSQSHAKIINRPVYSNVKSNNPDSDYYFGREALYNELINYYENDNDMLTKLKSLKNDIPELTDEITLQTDYNRISLGKFTLSKESIERYFEKIKKAFEDTKELNEIYNKFNLNSISTDEEFKDNIFLFNKIKDEDGYSIHVKLKENRQDKSDMYDFVKKSILGDFTKIIINLNEKTIALDTIDKKGIESILDSYSEYSSEKESAKEMVSEEEQEKKFEEYIKPPRVAEKTAKQYISILKNKMVEDFGFKAFGYDSFDEYVLDLNELYANELFEEKNNLRNNQFTAALNHYKAMLSLGEIDEIKTEHEKIKNELNDKLKPCNMLHYGIPGCGKSYYVKKEYCSKHEHFYERVTFYQDYSYTDFIGQIMPTYMDGKVQYKFIQGPFTKIMKRAILDADNKYVLIIEEINRGNAPAIFGDIFQLLDRDKNGVSEYGVTNEYIGKAIYGDDYANEKIFIPKNLLIVATMNTSDQNLFTLDTAFKRRFEFKMIEDSIDSCKNKDKFVPNLGITWKKFLEIINSEIITNEASFMGSEDKQLGSYFIKEECLLDEANIDAGKLKIKDNEEKIEKFAEKILSYLWDDAFKLDKSKIFDKKYNTLQQLIGAYKKDGIIIFSQDIKNKMEE